MATKEKGKAVKVPHGSPIPEGMDLDTSDYVNEVGPYDDDITKHPQHHEDKLAKTQLLDIVEGLKVVRGDDPTKVLFERKPNTKAGNVQVSLTFPDDPGAENHLPGDRFSAVGKTTTEAVLNLKAKLDKIYTPEEAVT